MLKCHIAAIGEKIARCVRINRWRKLLAIFACDQIRRDRRIKSPGVSPALATNTMFEVLCVCCGFMAGGGGGGGGNVDNFQSINVFQTIHRYLRDGPLEK